MNDLAFWQNVYFFSGLHGLLVSGAPIDFIDIIREIDRRTIGITREDDEIAREAILSAKKCKCFSIIQLPHKHWRSVTDCLFGSLTQYIVVMPSGELIVHAFCEPEDEIETRFGRRAQRIDDSYLLVQADDKEELFELLGISL